MKEQIEIDHLLCNMIEKMRTCQYQRCFQKDASLCEKWLDFSEVLPSYAMKVIFFK